MRGSIRGKGGRRKALVKFLALAGVRRGEETGRLTWQSLARALKMAVSPPSNCADPDAIHGEE